MIYKALDVIQIFGAGERTDERTDERTKVFQEVLADLKMVSNLIFWVEMGCVRGNFAQSEGLEPQNTPKPDQDTQWRGSTTRYLERCHWVPPGIGYKFVDPPEVSSRVFLGPSEATPFLKYDHEVWCEGFFGGGSLQADNDSGFEEMPFSSFLKSKVAVCEVKVILADGQSWI